MDFELRRARPGDARAVADVFLAARADAMPYLPALHTDEETHVWLRDVVLTGHEVVAAEVGGRLVGFASLDADTLAHLYVHPGLQRQGIGAALLARAKELRPNGFRLWVFQRNWAARRFYERRGLCLVELTDGAGNEEREPDALYEWRPTHSPRPPASGRTRDRP
jgi:GNAT superfamily N-acetyltransferase